MSESIESYESAINGFFAIGDIQHAAEASFDLGYIHCWNAEGIRALSVINRVVGLVDQPSLLGCRLLLLKAAVFCVMGEVKRSFAPLAEARDVEAQLPEATADGFANMCEARIRFMTAQLNKADECGREALTRFRALGSLWGEAETFEPVAAALWMGHPAETEAMIADLIPRAEKVGHQNAVWAYRSFLGQAVMAQGNLEKSDQMIRGVHEFALANSCGWSFLHHILLGAIAHYRGNFEEALQWIRSGIEIEPPSYQSGHLRGMLF